jgi:hypothetical protein
MAKKAAPKPLASAAKVTKAGSAPSKLKPKPKLKKKKAPPPRRSMPKKAKPVLYLYPRAPCQATVALRLADGSRLTTLLPQPCARSARNATWRVAAAPDGTLQPPAGPPVTSLFWEATPSSAARLLPAQARDTFCVPGPAAGAWLLGALRAWGLSPREATECAQFWAAPMGEHAFVQVRALPQAAWEGIAPLAVAGLPPPLRTLRLFLAWRGLPAFDASRSCGVLPAAPGARCPDTSWVVEWGGQELPALA